MPDYAMANGCYSSRMLAAVMIGAGRISESDNRHGVELHGVAALLNSRCRSKLPADSV
jgi:hypothetical protein